MQLSDISDQSLLMAANRSRSDVKKNASKQIDHLSDDNFAFIELGGEVANGKTRPGSLRHLPIHSVASTRNSFAEFTELNLHNNEPISNVEKVDVLKKIVVNAKIFDIKLADDIKQGTRDTNNEVMTDKYLLALQEILSDSDLREVFAQEGVALEESKINSKEKMTMGKKADTKVNDDPLAVLKTMRTQFTDAGDKVEFVKALDVQITNIEQSLVEKDKYADQLKSTVELTNTLKTELETIKAVSETQKVEYEKRNEEVVKLLAESEATKRKAVFTSLMSKVEGFAFPPQIDMLLAAVETPATSTPIVKFSRAVADGEPIVEDISMLEWGIELLLAVPEEWRPKALEIGVTSHLGTSVVDTEKIASRLSGIQVATKLTNPNMSNTELKKLMDEKKAALLAPGQ